MKQPEAAIENDGNVVIQSSGDNTGQKDTTSAVLHRSLHQHPICVTHAKGNYLYLSDGSAVLDSTGGAAVSCLGHRHPRIIQALTTQLSSMTYIHSLTYTSPAYENLAEFLTSSTQGRMSRAFMVSSGSEAAEAALKLARQYFLELDTPQPQRTGFIARHGSYHGNTLGALGVSGHKGRRKLVEPLLMRDVSFVPPCYAYRGMRDGESEDAYVARLAEELDNEFQRRGGDTVCAFIAEPVVGAALGCVPAVKGYFRAMKAVCEKHGALLILDEVMSGMGRTGTLHAWEQEDVVPDIQMIGKGLGGGYVPVAGLLINPRVVDVLERGTGAFMHGQTYQGHPFACMAALEVQRTIQEEGWLKNVVEMGRYLESLLREKVEVHENVGNVRGKGLFWGIELVKDKKTKEPFDPKDGIAMKLHEKALTPKYAFSLYSGNGTVDGVRGDHVLLAPAYNVTKDTILKIADLTARVITDFFEECKVKSS